MTASLMHDFLDRIAKGPHDLERLQAARDIDRLAEIRATIKALQSAEKDLTDRIIAYGFERVEAKTATCTVSLYVQSSTSWRDVANHFSPSRQLIAAHTTTSERSRVTTTPILNGGKS